MRMLTPPARYSRRIADWTKAEGYAQTKCRAGSLSFTSVLSNADFLGLVRQRKGIASGDAESFGEGITLSYWATRIGLDRGSSWREKGVGELFPWWALAFGCSELSHSDCLARHIWQCSPESSELKELQRFVLDVELGRRPGRLGIVDVTGMFASDAEALSAQARVLQERENLGPCGIDLFGCLTHCPFDVVAVELGVLHRIRADMGLCNDFLVEAAFDGGYMLVGTWPEVESEELIALFGAELDRYSGRANAPPPLPASTPNRGGGGNIASRVPDIVRELLANSTGAIERLFETDSGVMWVDHRESLQSILSEITRIIGAGSLGFSATEDTVAIRYKDRSTRIKIGTNLSLQHAVLMGVEELVAPDFGLRVVSASLGGDTVALTALTCRQWTELSCEFGELAVEKAFLSVRSLADDFVF